MNPENAIEVRNVTKYFKVYTDKGHMLRERIVHIGRNKYEKKEVLKDISFDIKKGEAVGLIGKNGCGKSTTLKMLTKILRPSSGTIEENGRVSSLIELGAGFHQDLTGRENIYINASIFGFSRKEVDQRIDDIIEFSELEDFIDNPVRTYSSGMYMRLAFSVAINVDADILLIDEILAVGDVNFQTKCFEKLKEIKAQGTTIVIVSHSMGQIEMICDKCIWIEDGHIKEEGPAKAVDKHYLEEMEEDRLAELDKQYQKKINNIEDIDKVIVDDIELPKLCLDIAKPKGNYKIKITDLHMFNQTGKETQIYNTGDVIRIVIDYEADTESIGDEINFVIGITRDDGVYCFGTSSLTGYEDERIKAEKKGSITLEIVNSMLEGRYFIDIAVQDMKEEPYEYINNALAYRVANSDNKQVGVAAISRKWTYNGREFEVNYNMKL